MQDQLKQELGQPPQPEQVVKKLNQLALEAYQKGQYPQGLKIAKQTQPYAERVLGPDHLDTLQSASRLAGLYQAQGYLAKAEPLFQRAWEGRQKRLGPDHPDTLQSLNDLAGLYHAKGRFAEAEPLFRRALEGREKVLGPDHPDTLQSLNDLAGLHQAQGRLAEAQPLFFRALKSRQETLGKDHRDTLQSFQSLAWLHQVQGRLTASELFFRDALDGRESILGREHPDTLQSVQSLAWLYQVQGRLAEAEPLFERALKGRESILGRDHPDTLHSFQSLAWLYQVQGRLAEAEPLFQRALEGRGKVLGLDHPNTLQSLNSVAELYQAQNRLAEAEPLFQRVLEGRKTALGPDHPDTLQSFNNLAELYQVQGHLAEAEPLFQRALEGRGKVLGLDHPDTLQSASGLARLYQAGGSYEEAEPLFQRALAGREIVLGPDHPDTLQSVSALARLYYVQGRHWDAAPLYYRALIVPRIALLVSILLASASAVGMYYFLRPYRHPLVIRLSTRSEALLELAPTELAYAKTLLTRTRHLDSVLASAGVQPTWLMDAMRFTEDDPKTRCQMLAQRLAAECRGPATNDPYLWSLPLGQEFPLNLEQCLLYLPPGNLAPADIFTRLQSRSEIVDQVTLILSPNPVYQSELNKRASDPANLWVAPSPSELTSLLLSSDPIQALAKLIASQVRVTRISPYLTVGGANKETVFFGRQQELAHIMNREPANYLVVGGRQLGKSTLLKAIERRYQGHPQVHCYYLVLSDAQVIAKLAHNLGLPIDTDLDGVLSHLSAQRGRRLFLVDEADHFVRAEQERDYTTLQRLRALSEEGRCHFILAGFWDLYEVAVLDYQSPLKNFGETLTIGALEEDACRDLATKPMATMNISYRSPELVERLVTATGQRANLISIACNEILKNLNPADRLIGADAVDQALDSDAIHQALAGWQTLDDQDPAGSRLDRIIVYATLEQGSFTLAELLRILQKLGDRASPERVQRSLARLELAYVLGRQQTRYTYQVPLFREMVLAQDPGVLLERELEAV